MTLQLAPSATALLVGGGLAGDAGGDVDDGVVLLLEEAVDDLVHGGVAVLDGHGGDAPVGGHGLLDVIAVHDERAGGAVVQ